MMTENPHKYRPPKGLCKSNRQMHLNDEVYKYQINNKLVPKDHL